MATPPGGTPTATAGHGTLRPIPQSVRRPPLAGGLNPLRGRRGAAVRGGMQWQGRSGGRSGRRPACEGTGGGRGRTRGCSAPHYRRRGARRAPSPRETCANVARQSQPGDGVGSEELREAGVNKHEDVFESRKSFELSWRPRRKIQIPAAARVLHGTSTAADPSFETSARLEFTNKSRRTRG